MPAETASAVIRDDVYRLSVLSYLNPVAGEAEHSQPIKVNGAQGVSYKFENGLYRADVTMPNGSHEYWAEVNSAYCVSTGFKAMAFERRNKDGSAYLDKDGKPEVQVVFPGSTQTHEDLITSRGVVYGEKMDEYFKDRADFMARVTAGIEARKGTNGDAKVTIGGHSIGANAAIGAEGDLKGTSSAKTYLIEPVGAGQALQQLTAKGGDPKKLADVVSVRDKNQNIFQGDGGDDVYDNIMIGQTYLIDTGFANRMTGHMASAIANAVANGKEIGRNPSTDLAPEVIARGGEALSADAQKKARDAADTMVAGLDPASKGKKTLTDDFNGQAERWLDAKPGDHPSFNFSPGVAQVPVATKTPIEEIKSYLQGKGFDCGAGEGYTVEMNNALAQCFAEAQLTPAYKTAYKEVYGEDCRGVDFMPGPATRAAMVARGVDDKVIKAMDDINLFNRDQRDDVYTPPENQSEVLRLAKNEPKIFPHEALAVAGGAPAAAMKPANAA